ncbi:MAG TPA: TonB-dependent receptor [Vicinamibacterales bacterium]|nr:TonB-dependent receptor [Vicinamibacterales bacterium]
MRVVALVLLVSVLAAPAWAQVQTGSILVKVVDDQGAAIPGVTVTVTSPVLPQPLVGVTDSAGTKNFTALTVGTYSVKSVLSGFQTTTREGVLVVQNQTVSIETAMKVGNMTEEVTVKGASPVVDTKSATVATNLDAMLLDTTPGGKDIWSILEYKIPGLVFDVPDVGGNQAGLQRSFTSRGTPNSQNVQLVNGVNVGDPAAIGFSMNYYEPATFENVQVTTGAQDISMGTSGTLINMVTRGGTNRFGGQVAGSYQGKKTQWDNVDETLKLAGLRPKGQAVDFITNANLQAGGPLLPNRLFWFANVNNQQTHVNVFGFPAVSPAQIPQLLSGDERDSTVIDSVSGKLTYSLGASNRFESYGNYQWYDKPNRGAGAGVTLDSNTKEYDTFLISQLSWNTVVTDKLVGDTKVAYSNTHFPLTQKTDLQSILDNSTSVRMRNAASSALMFRRRLQVVSNWNYYLSEFLGGRHEFKFGVDHGYTPEDVTTTRVDDVNLTWRSVAGTAAQPAGPGNVTIFNTPTLVKRAVTSTALYGQDTFNFNRLTVIGGIRWERIHGTIPAQTHGVSQYFPNGSTISGLNVNLNTCPAGATPPCTLTTYTVRDSFDPVKNAPLWKNWAPRVSATFDVSGTGKTVLKASAGKYFDQVGTGTPGPNPNGGISQQYAWNDINNNLIFDRGNAVWNGSRYVGGEFGSGTVTTTIPNPNPFDTARKRTWRREFTVSLDHELFPAFRLSLAFFNRREFDTYGRVDADLSQWGVMYSPVQIADPGRDGKVGTADDQTLTAYSLKPGFTEVTELSVNDNRLGPKYNGFEIVATKRYGRGTTLLGGYTYSRETVEFTTLENPNAALNQQGVSGGRRHNFKVSGSATLPYKIVFGLNALASSGLPITRTIQLPRCSTSVTTGCISQQMNNSVNAESRGSFELPGRFQIDMRLGRLFDLHGQRFEVGVDAYNLTNANTVYDVRTGTGLTNIRYAGDATQPVTQIATFNSPTSALGPRIVRFNVTYWFGGGTSAAASR